MCSFCLPTSTDLILIPHCMFEKIPLDKKTYGSLVVIKRNSVGM